MILKRRNNWRALIIDPIRLRDYIIFRDYPSHLVVCCFCSCFVSRVALFFMSLLGIKGQIIRSVYVLGSPVLTVKVGNSFFFFEKCPKFSIRADYPSSSMFTNVYN